MERNRSIKIFGLLLIIIFVSNYYLLPTAKIAYADIILDSKIHNIPCKDLPNLDVVQNIVNIHYLEVNEINEITKRTDKLRVVSNPECPEKGDILIYFCCHKNRVKIEEIINGDLFHGIPYRLINI